MARVVLSNARDLPHIFFHPAGAGRLHGVGNMAVNVQCKGRRGMAEVPLHPLHVVPVLQREHSVGVPQIVNSGVWRADLGGELLEMVGRGLGLQRRSKDRQEGHMVR